MEVHKFGGTSVSEWRSLVALAKNFRNPSIIVVSAFSGITDKLLESIEHARGVVGKQNRLPEVLKLHHEKLDEMEAAGLRGNRKRCEELLHTCEAMLRGVALVCGKDQESAGSWHEQGVPTPVHENTRDSIVAFGELLSASIISFALNCEMIDSRTLIRTDDTFGNANVDFATTAKLCEQARLTSFSLVVVPGFIASTANGLTSVLGRGGSDYTATILGASVRATKVVIWTDVHGVYSADPRLVKRGTYSLPQISFRESKEMAYFGSKVLFPKMVDCCERYNIPIEVRKTSLEPNTPFTLISQASTLQAAVSCIQMVAVIVLSGSGMKGVVGISAKVFLALKEAKASAIMICQASSEQELCIVVDQAVSAAAVASLDGQFAHELELKLIDKIEAKQGFSVVNLVLGASMQRPGIASRFFSAAANVNGFGCGALHAGVSRHCGREGQQDLSRASRHGNGRIESAAAVAGAQRRGDCVHVHVKSGDVVRRAPH
jgi:aspartokinase/homoserine dehydrogenase 1